MYDINLGVVSLFVESPFPFLAMLIIVSYVFYQFKLMNVVLLLLNKNILYTFYYPTKIYYIFLVQEQNKLNKPLKI